MISASYGLRLFDIGHQMEPRGFEKTPRPGEMSFNFVMVPVSKVRFIGVLGGVQVTVDFETSGCGGEDAVDFAVACAAALRDQLAPSAQQLQDTERAVNDAIQSEAARLERVTSETNQAYSRVMNQLALAYDRIAALERQAETNSVFFEAHTQSARLDAHETHQLKSSQDDLQRRFEIMDLGLTHLGNSVDSHSSMCNCFSRLHHEHEQAIQTLQQRLADLETPKPAAKSRAKKKATVRRKGATKKRGA